MTGIPDAVVELTDEERAELATWAREGIYHCPCRMRCMCDDEDKVYLFDAVGSIIAARFAAASGPWAEQLDAANPCAVCKEWETQYDAAMEQIERLQNRILKAEPRPNQPIDDFGGNIRSMYVRVSDGWLRRFDKWRKTKGLSRSGAIRKLVQDAWEADNAR